MRARTFLLPLALTLVVAVGTTGCTPAQTTSQTPTGPQPPTQTRVSYSNLPSSGRPDYQLGGSYTPPSGVTIVERDSTASPATGVYNICYVNGFQTQPEAESMWKESYPSAILRDSAGTPVSDPGWPDEMLLDTGTAAKRALIADVLEKSVARCGDRGFDAVEFDNLDSWTRSGKRLTRAGNLELAKSLVAIGHRHGLAVGQKNTPQLGSSGREQTGFDFVVAEECVQYQECSAYTKAYGDRVIDIEYSDAQESPWASVCHLRDRPAMTILRDRELVTPDEDAYVYEHC